jgi:hypothetical protein
VRRFSPPSVLVPDVQAPTASLLPLVFPSVCFCFPSGRPFCGGFAFSGQIWYRIGRPLDWFFFFRADLYLGFELLPSSVLFSFISFLGVFVFLCLWFFCLCFCFSKGVASAAHRLLWVFYASTPRRATIITFLGGSRSAYVRASPWLFMFLLLFPCIRFVFVFSIFATQPIYSAPISLPSIHCRAFPRDPSTTSP